MIKRNSIIKRNIELWKPVEGYHDYEISNMGRVKSTGRLVSGSFGSDRFLKEKILSFGKSYGYCMIRLYHFNSSKDKQIHLLVIEHFGKTKPTPKHECNHKDGDKSNNWDTNLEWLTHAQNIQHAYDSDLCSNKGSRHWKVKLTEKEVREIRNLYKTGNFTQKQLSSKFCIAENTINYIINFKTWKGLK